MNDETVTAPDALSPRTLLPGWCTVMLGIGLSRFAYSPLIPALVAARWFSPAATAYFGAANLAGYLLGAIAGRPLANRLPLVPLLRVAMLLAVATFFASAWPVSFAWYFGWRFVSGLAGGWLMVLGPSTIMQAVPLRKQGMAGGIMFSGIGLGIILSATLVPLLLAKGLHETWQGLGGVALIVTLLGWGGWPVSRPSATKCQEPSPERTVLAKDLRALYLVYGLNAAGLVPAMLFLVDYVARDLGLGAGSGASVWMALGIGATLGPVLAGWVGDRIGFKRALLGALLLQTLTLGAYALAPPFAVLVMAGFLTGVFIPGIVSLVAGRLDEIVPKAQSLAAWQMAWSTATVSFAIGQALSSFGYSYLIGMLSSHRPLFVIGALAMVAACVVEGRRRPR